jgi:Zn-dependent protease
VKALLAILAKGSVGKLLVTGGSMLVSIGAYALLFGWSHAAGLVLLILVHELGHYIAARQCHLEVGAPIFVPFVGAWIQLKEARMAPAIEAHVAIAGPMLGSGGALILYLDRKSVV